MGSLILAVLILAWAIFPNFAPCELWIPRLEFRRGRFRKIQLGPKTDFASVDSAWKENLTDG